MLWQKRKWPKQRIKKLKTTFGDNIRPWRISAIPENLETMPNT
jgi:hypothetical protein